MHCRAGIVASSYLPAAGGPTVSAIETIINPYTSSGVSSVDIPIATSLLSGDRVVVVVMKSSTGGSPAVSGLSATWTTDVIRTTTVELAVISAGGITGAGTITVSGLSTSPAAITVFVLRSSSGSPVTFLNGDQNAATVSGGTVVSTTAATATAGAFVIGSGTISHVTTMNFPDASTTPSSGWTTVRDSFDATTNDTNRVLARTVTIDTSILLAISASGVTSLAVLRAAYIP